MKIHRPEADVPWYACDRKGAKSIEKIIGVTADSDGSRSRRSSRSQEEGGEERVSVQLRERESGTKERDSVRERRDGEHVPSERDEDTEAVMSSDKEPPHVTVEVDVHQSVPPVTTAATAPKTPATSDKAPKGAPTSTAATTNRTTPPIPSGPATGRFVPAITSTTKQTSARTQPHTNCR